MNPEQSLTWLFILPFIFPPFIYLVGRTAYLRNRQATLESRQPITRWLCLAGMVLMWGPLFRLAQPIMAGQVVEIKVGSVLMRMDGIGFLVALTVLGLGTLITIFSFPYVSGEEGEEKYYALLPIVVGSIIGLACANDLFNLWVWFEAMAISTYFLVAFYANEKGSLEAGIKYLVQSAVGSVLVLMGISLVYARIGTLRLDAIAAWQGPFTVIFLAAGAQFMIGFGVKAAIVPMHTWLPDAHSQAPSGISAMLSGIVIEAGLIAMLRVVGSLPGQMPEWGYLLMGFGAINMLVGNLMALRQTQIKRMLAYSSLSHIGYMLLGLGAAAAFHNELAAAGGFFHLFTHSIMKGLAFLAAGALLYAVHISRGSHSPLIVDDLNGASRRYPLEAFGFSLAVLALGGLPPLAGFMSKWQIFAGAVSTQNLPMVLLVGFAALNSVLSLGYYAPLVNRLYRKEPGMAVECGKPVSRWMKAPIVVLILLVVVIGFYPSVVQAVTGPAAAAFISMFGGQLQLAGY
jgi:proton-translocating NADH-quinone oxidoreductase chain N